MDDGDVQPGDGVVLGFSLLTVEQTLVHSHSDVFGLVHWVGISLLAIEQTQEHVVALDGHILNQYVVIFKDNLHIQLWQGNRYMATMILSWQYRLNPTEPRLQPDWT